MKFISENLQRDVLVLTASRGVRAFAFSYLNIIFAIYLNQLGFSTMTVGLVISTAFASGAVLTAVWGFLSDRYGRKKILILLAASLVTADPPSTLPSRVARRGSAEARIGLVSAEAKLRYYATHSRLLKWTLRTTTSRCPKCPLKHPCRMGVNNVMFSLAREGSRVTILSRG